MLYVLMPSIGNYTDIFADAHSTAALYEANRTQPSSLGVRIAQPGLAELERYERYMARRALTPALSDTFLHRLYIYITRGMLKDMLGHTQVSTAMYRHALRILDNCGVPEELFYAHAWCRARVADGEEREHNFAAAETHLRWLLKHSEVFADAEPIVRSVPGTALPSDRRWDPILDDALWTLVRRHLMTRLIHVLVAQDGLSKYRRALAIVRQLEATGGDPTTGYPQLTQDIERAEHMVRVASR